MMPDIRGMPWLQQPLQLLDQMLETGRVPHALLVTGAPGTGKRLLADDFAARLLCTSPKGNQACGECSGCRLRLAGTHPDLLEVMPEEPGKQIRIDSIRELCNSLHLTAHAGAWRVAIVEPADQMNVAAANSLLKTLEEPVPGTVLILLSSRSARLPATVRSRCQQLRIAPASEADGQSWLATQLPDADPDLLLGLAGQSPLAALALADSPLLGLRAELLRDLEKLQAGQADPVAVADSWVSQGAGEILDWLAGCVADLIRLKSSAEPPMLVNRDLAGPLQALAGRPGSQTLFRQLDNVQQTRRLLATGSANEKLAVQDMLLRWSA